MHGRVTWGPMPPRTWPPEYSRYRVGSETFATAVCSWPGGHCQAPLARRERSPISWESYPLRSGISEFLQLQNLVRKREREFVALSRATISLAAVPGSAAVKLANPNVWTRVGPWGQRRRRTGRGFSTRILGRRTAPITPVPIPTRAPHGLIPRS